MKSLGLALVALMLLASACGGSNDAESQEVADSESQSTEPQSTDNASVEVGDDATDESTGTAGGENDGRTAAESVGFPVEVDTAVGGVVIKARPERIVSLSPTATEILFAIGAGDRVVAVDRGSDHPPEAPQGTLDGFAPDLESLLELDADLVVTSGLPVAVAEGLDAADVALIVQPGAASFDDMFDQISQLGQAVGSEAEAAATATELRAGIDDVLASIPTGGRQVRVFHEIDDSFYTATSASFVGQVYAAMGFENVADPFDDGTGFPLVEADGIIAADPTLIVFTGRVGLSADDVAARPGWGGVTAVREGNIVEVDADIALRWGPRIVEFMQAVAQAIGAA